MSHFRFDVDDASAGTYTALMAEVDGFYSRRAAVHFKGVPLTLRTEGFMTVSLDLGLESLDLAISGREGYLTAFREGEIANPDPERSWYHFSDTPILGLGRGRKRKLARESGYPSLIGENWSGIRAGGQALRHCCYVLSRFLRAHRQDPAAEVDDGIELSVEECTALARLIVMLCEPSKLRSARSFVISSFVELRDIRMIEKVKMKIKNWGGLSRYALHCLEHIIKDSDNFDPKELSKLSPLGIHSLDATVGPEGELYLIKCKDYRKESLDGRHRRT